MNGHTITVDAGLYAENIIVTKELSIFGPNEAIDACSGSRVAEAVLTTAVSDIGGSGAYSIIDVQASNVSIKGFTIDGDNTSITSGFTSTTAADIDIATGITRYVPGDNIVISNNIIKNVSYFAVELYDYPVATPSSGNVVSNNKILDLGTYDAGSGIDYWGGGIILYNNQYAQVENNCMTNVRLGIQTGNFSLANPGASAYQSISNNSIESRRVGIFHNLHYSSASAMTISNNTFTTLDNSNEGGWRGMLLGSLAVGSTITNNTINGTGSTRPVVEGINVWSCTTAPTISGGTISNVNLGINVNNFEGYNSDADNTSATISGVTISNASTAGIQVNDNNSNSNGATVHATIQGNTIINNTTTGLLLNGGSASASFSGSNAASFNGQSVYIDQTNNGTDAPSTNIDATQVSFDGLTGATATLTQNYGIENKINHKVDVSGLGFVRVKASEAFVTTASGSIQRGVDAASASDIVNVDAGNFAENVTVNKALTVRGNNADVACGSRVAESVINPASGTPVLITASDVNVNGFEISGANSTYGVSSTGTSNVSLTFNNIHNIGNSVTGTNIYGVIYTGGSSAASNITISDNCISDIAGTGLTGFSAGGIGILQSVSTGVLTGVNIERNLINNVIVNNGQWPTGKIAYGITLNIGGNGSYMSNTGKVVNASIKFNELTNLSGHIATGIGLEGNTENAAVENNSIASLSGTKVAAQSGGGYDLSGLKFENNKFVSTCTVKHNSFQVNTFSNTGNPGLGYAVSNYVPVANGGAATLDCNWYSTATYNDILDNGITGKILNKAGCQTNFVPYLVSGADGAGTGFQPTASCTGTPVVITSLTTTPNQLCQDNGQIAVDFSGGTGNYTISWAGAATGSVNNISGSPYTITGLTHGTYTVTVADSYGSTVSATTTILNNPVKNVTQNTYFATIQAAINDGSTVNNDVLSVCAGTYTEAISISKALTINGPNAGTPGTGSRVAEAILLNSTIDIANAGNTTIDGLKIMRNDGATGPTNQIELDGGGTSTVQNCIFERNGANTGQEIRAIATTTAGGNKVILNNKITGDASGGLFGGHKSWARGIYVDAGAYNVSINGNTFENCRTGINLDNLNANVTLAGNTINNNGTHISIGGSTPPSLTYVSGANDFINNAATTMINNSNVAESFRFDMSTSTLNGTPFASLTTSQLFEVEARMAHKEVSASKKGKVIYHANNQYVNNFTSPGTKIDVIQNSVKYFDAGETINLEDGTYNQRVVFDKNGITMQGVTTTEADFVLNGTGLVGNGNGITINSGITGSTIKNVTIQNYTGGGGNANAGIYGIGQNNNTTIDNVALLNNPTASGFYANGPVDDVEITNSTVSNNGSGARGIVIWNGLKTNINFSNNTVSNNNCCGIELQDGTASNVTIQGNAIDIGGGDNAIGVNGLRYGTNNITNNIITGGGRFGIEIKNPLNANAVVSGNTVTLSTQNSDLRDRAGIAVFRRGVLPGNPDGHPDQPSGVTISNNTVTGYQQTSTSTGFGIVVEGNNHSITGNTLNNNDVAVQLQAGHTPFTSNATGDGNQADLNDEYFGRGNSPFICGINIGTNTLSGNGIDYRLKTQLVSTTNLAQINSIIGGSVLNVNTSASYCSIQDAINAATAGDVLSLSANNFFEQVTVNKAVTINGPNAAINACTGTRVAEATIDAGTSGTAFTVTSTGVTISGLSILGANGIVSNTGATVTATNNIIDVSTTGISLTANGSSSIMNNRIESDLLGITATASSNGGTISSNCVDLTTQYNTLANQATVGILLNGVSGNPLTVASNTITDGHYGYVLHAANPSNPQTISGGTVSGVMQGVAVVNALPGGSSLYPSNAEVNGVMMSGFTGTSPVSAQNFHAGVYTFTAPGTTTANGINLLVTGTTIDGTQTVTQSSAGIYLADFSGGGSMVQTVTIQSSTIQNNTNRGIDARGKVGVYVIDNTITNNGGAAYGTGGNDGFTILAQQGANVTATNNFIVHPASSTTSVTAFLTGNGTGNFISALNNSVLMNGNTNGMVATNSGGNTLNATCNWLGSTSPATNNPLANVNLIPWLIDGTDAIPAAGFQPLVPCSTPCNLVVDINATNISCNGENDGEANAVITSGGVAPYTYAWSNGGSSVSITGLTPTTYTVTVTNANGCSATSSTTITEPAVLVAGGSVTSNYNGEDVSCFGATDGEITASGVGGSTPYTYDLNGGGFVSNPVFTGNGPGTYVITVKDANGCTSSTTVLLNNADPIVTNGSVTSNYNGTQVSCAGGNDGQITVIATGGVAGFTYAINGGAYGASNVFSGLTAGTYTIDVKDANGCAAQTEVTIVNPDPVVAGATVSSNYNGSQVSCNGSADGSILASGTGGTGVYEYKLNSGSYQPSS
ncbi:MAG: right-handed parallel beta-helix repeat-containing protein, partial [Chitinophagaceae bacterium]|nr:right-handed parallel beta-helix repeat-containing protein [Chitinophagaceae bacterium]